MKNETFSIFLNTVCVCKAVETEEAVSLMAQLLSEYPGEEIRLETA